MGKFIIRAIIVVDSWRIFAKISFYIRGALEATEWFQNRFQSKKKNDFRFMNRIQKFSTYY